MIDFPIFILSDSLNEKKMNDHRVQALFKRSKHSNISVFINRRDYYEILKRIVRANGNLYHIFKPSRFRDVQGLYQDKANTNMTLTEFKLITSTRCKEKYEPLTFDMKKDKKYTTISIETR